MASRASLASLSLGFGEARFRTTKVASFLLMVLIPRQREFDEYENLRYSLDTTDMEERQTCLNKNTSWI